MADPDFIPDEDPDFIPDEPAAPEPGTRLPAAGRGTQYQGSPPPPPAPPGPPMTLAASAKAVPIGLVEGIPGGTTLRKVLTFIGASGRRIPGSLTDPDIARASGDMRNATDTQTIREGAERAWDEARQDAVTAGAPGYAAGRLGMSYATAPISLPVSVAANTADALADGSLAGAAKSGLSTAALGALSKKYPLVGALTGVGLGGASAVTAETPGEALAALGDMGLSAHAARQTRLGGSYDKVADDVHAKRFAPDAEERMARGEPVQDAETDVTVAALERLGREAKVDLSQAQRAARIQAQNKIDTRNLNDNAKMRVYNEAKAAKDARRKADNAEFQQHGIDNERVRIAAEGEYDKLLAEHRAAEADIARRRSIAKEQMTRENALGAERAKLEGQAASDARAAEEAKFRETTAEAQARANRELAIEKAHAALVEAHQKEQDAIGAEVASVTENLPPDVQEAIRSGDIDASIAGKIGEMYRESFTRLSNLIDGSARHGIALPPEYLALHKHLTETLNSNTPRKIVDLMEFVRNPREWIEKERAAREASEEFKRTGEAPSPGSDELPAPAPTRDDAAKAVDEAAAAKVRLSPELRARLEGIAREAGRDPTGASDADLRNIGGLPLIGAQPVVPTGPRDLAAEAEANVARRELERETFRSDDERDRFKAIARANGLDPDGASDADIKALTNLPAIGAKPAPEKPDFTDQRLKTLDFREKRLNAGNEPLPAKPDRLATQAQNTRTRATLRNTPWPEPSEAAKDAFTQDVADRAVEQGRRNVLSNGKVPNDDITDQYLRELKPSTISGMLHAGAASSIGGLVTGVPGAVAASGGSRWLAEKFGQREPVLHTRYMGRSESRAGLSPSEPGVERYSKPNEAAAILRDVESGLRERAGNASDKATRANAAVALDLMRDNDFLRFVGQQIGKSDGESTAANAGPARAGTAPMGGAVLVNPAAGQYLYELATDPKRKEQFQKIINAYKVNMALSTPVLP